jgi:hypothetical protein
MAMNCRVVPSATLGLDGVTATETSVAGVTVRFVLLEMPPAAAVIIVVPVASGMTKPFEPAALLMAAIDACDEPQVTVAVRFCVEPSEYSPVAMNCWVVPSARLGLDGVIARETSVAGVTIRVVPPEMFPAVAAIVVEPIAMGVTRPCEPGALLTTATDACDEPQATSVVRSCVEPSEYVPVAKKCAVVPSGMPGLVGVIARETSVAGVTVRVVLPEMPPHVALIMVEPFAAAVANPIDSSSLLIAAAAAEELQVTDAVISWVELSEYVPVALNCCAVPRAMAGFVGETAMDTSVAAVTVNVLEPEIFVAGSVAVIVVVPADAETAFPIEPEAMLTLATPLSKELQVTMVVMSCVELSE